MNKILRPDGRHNSYST